MQAVEPDISKAFPANGKIVVKFGGKTAEALLELPAPSTRDGAQELPGVVWLTVGLLATDTFALQVKSDSRQLHSSERNQIPWGVNSRTYSLTCSLSLSHSLTPSLTPSHPHSLPHTLTHSLTLALSASLLLS